MQDFLKDHGEWVMAVVGYLGAGILLIFGLGKLAEKQKGINVRTDERLEVLEDIGSKCDTVIRIPDCDRYRKESRIARAESRENTEKFFEDLREMMADMRKENENQHRDITAAFNDQHKIVIRHLLGDRNEAD